MSHYLAHATPQNISLLLLIAVVIWICYRAIIHHAERQPFMEDKTLTGSVDWPPALPETIKRQENMAAILTGMSSLRTDLRSYRNPTPPASSLDEVLARHGVDAQDRADMIRGTKLP